RWYCPQCQRIWVDTLPPCYKAHPVHTICGYGDCPKKLQPGQVACCEEHGLLAARAAYGLHEPQAGSAAASRRLTGLWLFRARLRLGISRSRVAELVHSSGSALYAVEVHDKPIPPGWGARLVRAGFIVAASLLGPSGLTGRWLEAERRRQHCSA